MLATSERCDLYLMPHMHKRALCTSTCSHAGASAVVDHGIHSQYDTVALTPVLPDLGARPRLLLQLVAVVLDTFCVHAVASLRLQLSHTRKSCVQCVLTFGRACAGCT